MAMTLPAGGTTLRAIQADWALRAQADPVLLRDIAGAVGGPFHVIHPPRFGENLSAFQATLRAAGVDGQTYFAKKANKAGAWLDECVRRHDAGIDVASVPELVRALAHGARGENIVVTGAAKSTELLWLAARQRCLIAVDNLDELDRLTALDCPARILLRVLPDVNPNSRFGLDPAQLQHALDRCVTAVSTVTMDGFSFHLDGYQVQPRADLAGRLIDACLAARAKGLAATAISIGGGFACSYLEPGDWQRFQEEHSGDWFHAGKQFTGFYPSHQAPTGADMLRAILDRVGSRFAETGTRLFVEPGRALLDQAGFSVFGVQGYKERGEHGVVTVNGNTTKLEVSGRGWRGGGWVVASRRGGLV